MTDIGVGGGRKMVASAERWLRNRKVARLQLMVRETKAGAAGFYERHGFEFMPRVAMSKWLDR